MRIYKQEYDAHYTPLFLLLEEFKDGMMKAWRLGTISTRRDGSQYCSLNKHWQMVHKSRVQARGSTLEPLEDWEYDLFIDAWNSDDMNNAKRIMIVALFDERKVRKTPPSPKTTILQ